METVNSKGPRFGQDRVGVFDSVVAGCITTLEGGELTFAETLIGHRYLCSYQL
jgi:hypothetical protein